MQLTVIMLINYNKIAKYTYHYRQWNQQLVAGLNFRLLKPVDSVKNVSHRTKDLKKKKCSSGLYILHKPSS